MKVATKLPVWQVKGRDDPERLLSEQLERLQLDSIDFYLLHGLGADSLDQAARARRARLGRAGAGRRSHRPPGVLVPRRVPVFEELRRRRPISGSSARSSTTTWTRSTRPARRGLEYAADKGLGVIVMEPVRGGQLARRPPAAVAALWAAANARREAAGLAPRTPVDWALQWVWNHPEVSFLLSGMSSMAAARREPGKRRARRAGRARRRRARDLPRGARRLPRAQPHPLHDCRYCLPCPSGVDIPEVLDIYNEAEIYGGGPAAARFAYGWLSESERAEACTPVPRLRGALPAEDRHRRLAREDPAVPGGRQVACPGCAPVRVRARPAEGRTAAVRSLRAGRSEATAGQWAGDRRRQPSERHRPDHPGRGLRPAAALHGRRGAVSSRLHRAGDPAARRVPRSQGRARPCRLAHGARPARSGRGRGAVSRGRPLLGRHHAPVRAWHRLPRGGQRRAGRAGRDHRELRHVRPALAGLADRPSDRRRAARLWRARRSRPRRVRAPDRTRRGRRARAS